MIELLIAMTILTLIMSSLYLSLRTCMRAYEQGMRSAETLQTVRYLTDIMARDARSVFYQNADEYNKEYRKKEHERRRLQENRLREGLPDEAFDNPDWADPLDYNALSFMHAIDLSFHGKPEEVQFVRFQPTYGELVSQPWGLARVTYKYNGGDKTILREEAPVFELSADNSNLPEGVDPEQFDTTISEVIAENVVAFQLSYGYFYDGQWLRTEEWESNNNDHRNPKLVSDDPEDPLNEQVEVFNEQLPVDDLPTYMIVAIEVESPSGDRTMDFRQLILMQPATESFQPIPPNLEQAGISRYGGQGWID